MEAESIEWNTEDQALDQIVQLDLQSLFGLHVLYSCPHWLRSRNSPPPPDCGQNYEGAMGHTR